MQLTAHRFVFPLSVATTLLLAAKHAFAKARSRNMKDEMERKFKEEKP
jgi:hypothetical protein